MVVCFTGHYLDPHFHQTEDIAKNCVFGEFYEEVELV